MLGVLLGGTLYFVTRPKRLAVVAGSLLSEMLGAPVLCDWADFNFDGLIHLHNVRLELPRGVSRQGTLFAVDEVVVHSHVASLLHGKFQAQTLNLINPTLYLTEDAASGKFTYQLLKRKVQTGPHTVLNELPEIAIHGGRIQFGEIENNLYTELGVIHIGGSMTAQPQVPGAYHFTLQQEHAGSQAGGAVLTGDFDLIKLAVTAKLEGFTFESPQRMILPHRYRQWWDRLDPKREP